MSPREKPRQGRGFKRDQEDERDGGGHERKTEKARATPNEAGSWDMYRGRGHQTESPCSPPHNIALGQDSQWHRRTEKGG